jgi:hypothetical protein
MAIPQPSVRPLAPPQRGNAPSERAATASPQTILAEQLEITHRAAMSGMASVADWSDALRSPQMTTGGKENYSAMISRLSQSLTRMMAESRRTLVTLDRLQRASAEPERDAG